MLMPKLALNRKKKGELALLQKEEMWMYCLPPPPYSAALAPFPKMLMMKMTVMMIMIMQLQAAALISNCRGNRVD